MQENTAVATMKPIDRAALALGTTKTELHLKELAAKAAPITSVTNMDGRTEAHQAAMALRKARTTIKSTAEAARADANAFCSAVIAEEKRLIGMVKPEEDRLLALRDGYDEKVAAEKAEADRKEAERVATIKAKIAAIRDLPMQMVHEPAAVLDEEVNALVDFVVGDDFAEFKMDAQEAVRQSILGLNDLFERAKARDAEAARQAALAEENRLAAAELERQRAELAAQQAERERVAADTKRQMEEQQAAINAQRAEMERQQQEFAQKMADQEAAHERRKQELAAQAEADRIAALPADPAAELPTERVVEILEASGVNIPMIEPEHVNENIRNEPEDPETDLAQLDENIEFPPLACVDDTAEIDAFRAAARAVLETRTADEVITMLSQEIELFTLSVAA